MVVTIPYPGASPETVEREIINRVEKSLQSIPQVYQIALHRARRARRRSSSSSTSRRTCRGGRRDPQRDRLGALQAADRDARADPARASTRRRSRSCSSRCRRRRRRTRRSRAWPRTCSPTASARIDGVAHGERRTARCKRELSVLLHAQKLREFNVSVTEVVERAARAEHDRARGPREGRARRAEHPPRRPHRVAGASSTTSWSSAAATRSCASGRSRPSRTASPSSPAISLRNAHPNVGISITRSRDASTVTVAERSPRHGRGDQQDAARGHQARGHAGRRQGRGEQPPQRDRRADLRRGAHDLRGVRVPQLVALDADHRRCRCRPRPSPRSSRCGCAASR